MADLEAMKQASTAQLLFRCARRVDALAVGRIREALGLSTLRTAHTALFPHIDLDGTRPTEVARRLGVSKQAVGPLLDELVEMGVLEKVGDPSDGRARLVRFVGGGAALVDGLERLRGIEAELAEGIGPAHFAALHAALTRLDALLDAPPYCDRNPPSATKR